MQIQILNTSILYYIIFMFYFIFNIFIYYYVYIFILLIYIFYFLSWFILELHSLLFFLHVLQHVVNVFESLLCEFFAFLFGITIGLHS